MRPRRLQWSACLLLSCGSHQPEPGPPATGTVSPTPSLAPQVLEAIPLAQALTQSQAFLATRPEFETPLGVGLKTPPGLGSLSAESCGACHTEIYEEWRVSTHAAAWTDRQYQAEIGKSGNRWLCLNCHTPLLVQQDLWPVGLQDGDVEAPLLVPNPSYDASLREEGITCAACHVRDGAIHGPGLADSTPPHPVVADPQFTSTAICERCHQATATYPGKPFICTFDSGGEWRAGPYDELGIECQDCHMPRSERPAANGGPTRTVASHWWRGAGIPKTEGVHPPREANPPGLALDVRWEGAGVVVTATNASAGHMLPTGDPERWVQVDLQFVDAEGAPLGESESERFGQDWEWWPEPKELGDTRLAPKDSRTWTVPAPAAASSVQVRASSHRLSAETAEYHHLDNYPRSVQTHAIDVPKG
jgi:hypothetical protein